MRRKVWLSSSFAIATATGLFGSSAGAQPAPDPSPQPVVPGQPAPGLPVQPPNPPVGPPLPGPPGQTPPAPPAPGQPPLAPAPPAPPPPSAPTDAPAAPEAPPTDTPEEPPSDGAATVGDPSSEEPPAAEETPAADVNTAADGVQAKAQQDEWPAPHDLPPGEKRQPQDYDGRGEYTSTGEDLLWVPRVIFFPVYLVTEYVVRAPLGALTVWVEEDDVIAKVTDLFTFGPDNNIALVPTAFFEFGFRASVGVYFAYDDFLTRDNDLRANLGYGGEDWYKATLADRVQIDDDSSVTFRGSFLHRPDHLFWGIGPDSRDEDESTFQMQNIGGRATLHTEFSRGNIIEFFAGADTADLDNVECEGIHPQLAAAGGVTLNCDDPGILNAVAVNRTDPSRFYPTPPGFESGYTAVRTGLRLILDSRKPRPEPGTGIAFDIYGEHNIDVRSPAAGRWMNYGGTLAGFVDLTGHQRVLSLSASVKFADSLDDEYEVPFTELVGTPLQPDLMRGFRPGRLLGQSAAYTTLEYRWPVWSFLDGTLQYSVGNTFGDHLEDFDAEKLRMSFAGGIRSINFRDHAFNLLLGAGTETFESGTELTSLRFLFGGTTGF